MKTQFSFSSFFGKHEIVRKTLISISLFLCISASSWAQTIPYTVANNSIFADNEVYVCMVGKISGGHVWMDVKTGAVHSMNVSDNTVQGPIYGGNKGPGNNAMYCNYFSKLSDIPNKTINVPRIEGCRIFISFKSQLYLYVFGATGGYAGVSLSNATDPNTGIRFEMVELTNAVNGLWSNTTRVDSYQYPMGLEVWGNNGFYKKIGEMKTHDQIIAQWKATAPAEFQTCYDATNNIIKFPTKNASFLDKGAYANYFQSYIDAIWSKYTTADLVFTAGDIGVWKGRVSGDKFTFTNVANGLVGVIARKPTNLEVMEGSGTMAEGGENDKNMQKFVCASINRHVIDLNAASGVNQIWSDDSKYYQTAPYNWYCKFFHSLEISYEAQTYTFCYDDVYDKSSTINCPSAIKALITLGGFAGANNPVTGVSISPTSASINVGATQQLTATVTPTNATNNAVTYTSSNTAIATVNASGLVTGVTAGTATITVTTQDGSKTATSAITVVGTVSTNLALNKATTTSSTENASYAGSYAVDGNSTTTRWSSVFADPQWIYVDLGATYNVNRVKITWEAACGSNYLVQISADASTWTTMKTITGNTTLVNDQTGLSGSGRYVRIYGTTRATAYGYSMFELEVYGTSSTTVSVTGVSLSPTTATLTAGGTQQLTATVAPSNATNKTVTYTSSNTAIATVNASGLITAVSAGSATITVTTQDGSKTATCAVTVNASTIAVTGVTLSPTTASIAVGATQQLTATVAPTNATNKTVTYTSSNTAVATVNASGLVTGVASGTATITVTTTSGAKTATCAVTVTGSTPCSVTASTGDFKVNASSASSNPTLTFVPVLTGAGSSVCILYYNTSATGTFPGYTVTPNTPFQITAAAGTTIYFYYTYSTPSNGEKSTINTKNSFTVGSCSTLKSAEAVSELSDATESIFEVYPVPMKDVLNLKFDSNLYNIVYITNLEGNIVLKQEISSEDSTLSLDVSQLMKGAYFLTLQGATSKMGKLIIK